MLELNVLEYNRLLPLLAGKLGFSALPDYSVYYWEEA